MDDHDVAVGLAGDVGGDGAEESAGEGVDAAVADDEEVGVGFVDDAHKAGNTTPTSLKFTFSKVAISGREPSYGLSDISTETINFEGLLDVAAGKMLEAELINKFSY